MFVYVAFLAFLAFVNKIFHIPPQLEVKGVEVWQYPWLILPSFMDNSSIRKIMINALHPVKLRRIF
jgi:hypothetical protein